MNKNVGLCHVLGDLVKGFKCCEVISVAFLSLVLSISVYCTNNFSLEELKCVIYTLLPNLIGFSLTIYVVLFGISSLIIERLKEKSDDNKIPFEVLHATFMGGFLFQILTLFITFILDITKCDISICWINVSICFLLSFSLIWLINMILHLYSLRTFMIIDKKQK